MARDKTIIEVNPPTQARTARVNQPKVQFSQPTSASGNSPELTTCRCTPDGKVPKRNLVICIDGTSNQFSEKNTNVVELYNQLVKDETQLTYYNSGIGTYARSTIKSFRMALDNTIDLAIAWNFDKVVKGAYRWLSENYQDGDRIFLFGFSRGAYQVRALAGMINKVGLIYKGNEEQIPFAYELYADLGKYRKTTKKTKPSFLRKKSSDTTTQNPKTDDMADRFKRTFSREGVRVHFIGVWDTVSSIGLFRGNPLSGTTSQHHTCFFRHSLALDERRVKFLPEYAGRGMEEQYQTGAASEQAVPEPRPSKHIETEEGDEFRDANVQATSKQRPLPHIKEVWFPGTHSDVGGGNVENKEMNRRHPAFLWMVYEAISADLKVKLGNISAMEWMWKKSIDESESLTWVWKLLEYLPITHPSYNNANTDTLSLHRGRGRTIKPGQKLHASLAFCEKTYRPKAKFSVSNNDKKFWKDLVGSGNIGETFWEDFVGSGDMNGMGWTQGLEGLLEMDIFDISTAANVIQEIETLPDPTMAVHRLTVMSWSTQGCMSLYGLKGAAPRLVGAIKKLGTEIQVSVANVIIEFIDADTSDFTSLSSFLLERGSSDTGQAFFHKFIHDTKASQKKLEAVSKWANDDGLREKMMDHDIVTAVLTMLMDKSSAPAVRHAALECTAGFVKDKVARAKMFASNVVAALLTMFGDEYLPIRQSALKCITELTQFDDSREKILESNIVDDLLARLESFDTGHSHVRQSVVLFITKLVEHEVARLKILDSDIVAALLTTLGDNDSNVRRSALECTEKLLEYDDAHRKILDPRIVEAVLNTLGDRNSNTRVAAIKCTTKFADHDDARQRILHSNIFAVLPIALGSWYPSTRQSALDCTAKLVVDDDACRKMLDSDMLAALLITLGDPKLATRQSAFDCIAEFTIHECSRHKMLDSDIIVAFLTTLGDGDPDARQSAVKWIAKLANYGDSRRKMLDFNIIATLLTALKDDDQDVHQSALECITELVTHDDARQEIFDSHIMPILPNLGGGKDIFTPKAAAGNLNEADDARQTISESTPLVAVV